MQNQPGCEMPRVIRHPVTIKGIRDGLVFLFDDQCPFEDILADLEEKLHGAQGQLLIGPIVHVTIQTGKRILSPEEQDQVRDLLSVYGNLIIQEFVTSTEQDMNKQKREAFLYKGTVRSGQRIEHDGDVMVIGDVNPGGQVVATGDIYIMGTMRGLAHAGYAGNDDAIIAAVYFQPTQLRIGNVISRSPDPSVKVQSEVTEMEFAYLKNGQMAVDKLPNLHRVRVMK